jgi:putative addiction module component (TIGR02574 family)
MSFEEVKSLALQLSVKQRAELAKQLLDSTDNPSPEELEELWAEEFDRRLTVFERGEMRSLSREEMLKRVKATLQ